MRQPKASRLVCCMTALIARLILRSQHLTLFSPLFHLASRGLLPSVVPLACLADRLLNITLPPPPPCTTPYLQLFLLSPLFISGISPTSSLLPRSQLRRALWFSRRTQTGVTQYSKGVAAQVSGMASEAGGA